MKDNEVVSFTVERAARGAGRAEGRALAHPDPDRWGAEVVASAMPFQPVIDGEVIPRCAGT